MKQTNLILTELFKNLARDELLVEQKRQTLGNRPDFNPTLAFRIISQDGTQIKSSDFDKFLSDKDAKACKEAVESMVEDYCGIGQ